MGGFRLIGGWVLQTVGGGVVKKLCTVWTWTWTWTWTVALALGLVLASSVARAQATTAPLRFLLTFDDGPSAKLEANPTEQVLATLADNPIQGGVKALFFVQTAAANAGASAKGRALIQRQWQQGHALGFHTATRGHTRHTLLKDEALVASLQTGLAQLEGLVGERPQLVRPPGWAYDARTHAHYADQGLALLMTDLSANDGKIPWPNHSWRRRGHFEDQMRALRARWASLPVVEGVRPVVVTFHDPNAFTAGHLVEYLQILLDAAEQAGLPVASRPFYDERASLLRAAQARTVDLDAQPVVVPGFWMSLWAWVRPKLPLAPLSPDPDAVLASTPHEARGH